MVSILKYLFKTTPHQFWKVHLHYILNAQTASSAEVQVHIEQHRKQGTKHNCKISYKSIDIKQI